MELRKLVTNDLFTMSRILKKMNLKSDLKTSIDTIKKEIGTAKSVEGTVRQHGFELIANIAMAAFENIHMAQAEVNEFIGSLVGMTGKEFGELPIEESFEIINQVKNIPGISNFLSKASQ